MKKYILPILACALIGVTSCESMLDIPQKGVVSYDSFYANDDDAKAALTNMYRNFIYNVAGTEGIDNPEQVMLNYSADDILAAGNHFTNHEPFRYFCEFKYDASNVTLQQAYQRYCYAIYHANLVISNFTTENRYKEEPKWTSKFVDQAVAEARVMRAYLHMMMALSWNTPAIIDRVLDADEMPVSAESQEAVLKWVVEQCQMAIDSNALPVRADKNDKDNTARMNLGFAQFVAGKASVFRGQWADARKYLGDLIGSGKYDLVPSEDYWINFHIAGDGSVEKIFEPNVIEDPSFTTGYGGTFIGRWMVANTFCWRSDVLAGTPQVHVGIVGWNGGAIQETFAKRFLEHDGDSPRRKACFITEEEFLYEMDWANDINAETGENKNLTLEEKKKDPLRGISSANGLFSHGPYFEWKHMVFINPPKILTNGKEYPSDNIAGQGPVSNQTNFGVARFAEALLLYAEACLPENGASAAEQAEGLKALNRVQERSGSGKITALTFANVMEEKQYEMWFEDCRFHDVVRWSQQRPSDVNLDDVFNKSEIHKKVPSCFDAFFTREPGYETYLGKEHKFFTRYAEVPGNYTFDIGKHEYFPFPLTVTSLNPNLKSYGKWSASAQ